MSQRDEEPTDLGVYYLDLKSLSAYDLIEFISINNTSHDVKCSTFDALQRRAKSYAAEGPEGKFGLPYYIYRHESSPETPEGRDYRIVPTKSHYWENYTVERVYDKLDFLNTARDAIWNKVINTLHMDWRQMTPNHQQFLWKIAKGYYKNFIEANVAKFNDKVSDDMNDSRHEITSNIRTEAITWGKLPEKQEFDRYKSELKSIFPNFLLNRTRGDVRTEDGYASSVYNATTDDEAEIRQVQSTQQSEGYWEDPAPVLGQDRPLSYEELMNREFPILHIPAEQVDTPRINRVNEPEGDTTREMIEMGVSQHRGAATSTPFIRNGQENENELNSSSVSNMNPIGTPRQTEINSSFGNALHTPTQVRARPTTAEKEVTFSADVLERRRSQDNHSPIRSSLRRTVSRPQTESDAESTHNVGEQGQRAVQRSEAEWLGLRSRAPGTEERVRTVGEDRIRRCSPSPSRRLASQEKPRWEFGAKQVNYTEYDHRDQDQSPADFFNNLLMEINTNLKRGTVWDLELERVFQLLKSTVKHKEKKKALEREVTKKSPRNMNELKTCFADSMTISNQLRKTRFGKITAKPSHETWSDFAQRFEKMFEVAYGMDSEGGANQVLMERFQRCLNTPREIETLQQYLLMVDEKFQNIHSLAEKLEIIEYLNLSKTEEKHPVYLLKAKAQTICNFCQKTGHVEEDCRKKKSLKQENQRTHNGGKQNNSVVQQGSNQRRSQNSQNGCSICGRNNHTASQCYANVNGQNSSNHRNQNQNKQSNWNSSNRQVRFQEDRNGQHQFPTQNRPQDNYNNNRRQTNSANFQGQDNRPRNQNNWNNNNQQSHWKNNNQGSWNNNQRDWNNNNQGNWNSNNQSNWNNNNPGNWNNNNKQSNWNKGRHPNDRTWQDGQRDTNYKFNKFRRQ